MIGLKIINWALILQKTKQSVYHLLQNIDFINNTNCLAYRYRYRPTFYNSLPVFLEKAQATRTNQNFIIRCRYFSCCYLFVSLWHCSHMSLSYLSSDDGLMFFCFAFCGALGLCCCVLNPKSTRGVTYFLVWWEITISPTCMHISGRIFGWIVRSLD